MDIGQIKQASAASDEGVWVGEDVHGLQGVEFLVRPMSAPAVFRELGRRSRQAPDDMRDANGDLTPEAEDAIDDTVMAERVLMGWRGLTQDGEDVPYSLALAREFVGYSLFWTAVRASMQHATVQARTDMERLAKNSAAPSDNS